METKANNCTILDAVIQEVNSIKEHATANQINKLRIELLNPNNINKCIYGLMCGGCYSNEANELIKVCKPDVSFYTVNDETETCLARPVGFSGYLDSGGSDYRDSFTALEWYISKHRDNNPNIIAYLKGETETLTLPPIE